MDKQGMLCKIYETLTPDREMLVCGNCGYLWIEKWCDDAQSGYYYICKECKVEYCKPKRKIISYKERKEFDESAVIMIGDVLDYMQSNNLLSECVDILWIWNNKRKPIKDQSEYCIEYVYNLLG